MSGYGQGGYGQGGYGQGGYGQQQSYGQGGGYSAGGYGNNNYNAQSQNPYGQAAGNPYGGSNTGYGQSGQTASYAQQQQAAYDPAPPANAYGQQSSYTGGAYPQKPAYEDVEMSQPGFPKTPQELLEWCGQLSGMADDINNKVTELRGLHARAKDVVDANPTTNPTLKAVDSLSATIMQQISGATNTMRRIKGSKFSGDDMVTAQIQRVDTKLKGTLTTFQTEDRAYQKALREQLKRQYKIVRPEASDAEAEEAAQEQNTQIFSQALMQSDRRGQAQSALGAVKNRHAAIQKIESQMMELATLFEEMNEIIVQQEEKVQQIDNSAQAVQTDVAGANEQLGGAIVKARAARKKKWICLGIVVAIILIVVIVVLAWGYGSGTFKSGNNNSGNGH